jgi:hypothetical protein
MLLRTIVCNGDNDDYDNVKPWHGEQLHGYDMCQTQGHNEGSGIERFV